MCPLHILLGWESKGAGQSSGGRGAALLKCYSVVPGEHSPLCCHLLGPSQPVLSTWANFPDFLSQPRDFWLFLKLPTSGPLHLLFFLIKQLPPSLQGDKPEGRQAYSGAA